LSESVEVVLSDLLSAELTDVSELCEYVESEKESYVSVAGQQSELDVDIVACLRLSSDKCSLVDRLLAVVMIGFSTSIFSFPVGLRLHLGDNFKESSIRSTVDGDLSFFSVFSIITRF